MTDSEYTDTLTSLTLIASVAGDLDLEAFQRRVELSVYTKDYDVLLRNEPLPRLLQLRELALAVQQVKAIAGKFARPLHILNTPARGTDDGV